MTRFGKATPGEGLRNLVGARSEPNRFLRGAELADRGVVTAVEIRTGELRGSVTGSRRESYSVKITIQLTGSTIGAGSPIRWSCTCPDWGDPCKHAVAVMLVVSQQVDEEPELLGRFVGTNIDSDAPAEDDVTTSRRRARVAPPPVPPVTTDKHAGLPVVAPLWAEALDGPLATVSTVREFFGAPLRDPEDEGTSDAGQPIGEGEPLDDSLIGSDRLRQLGPLVVDTYDLAPDILRMYTGLRDR